MDIFLSLRVGWTLLLTMALRKREIYEQHLDPSLHEYLACLNAGAGVPVLQVANCFPFEGHHMTWQRPSEGQKLQEHVGEYSWDKCPVVNDGQWSES